MHLCGATKRKYGSLVAMELSPTLVVFDIGKTTAVCILNHGLLHIAMMTLDDDG